MNSARIAISIDQSLLGRVDSLVRAKRFRSRSEVFRAAVSQQLVRLDHDSLLRECAKLDAAEEQAFADMGLSSDISEWPAY
ncbi:MAG: ribbon-helix-helix domain-containing protein [Verrucomicrobia bacterium]|nr:ribbon-helix-helix domain-containing protein [Verrucomicrobiota bacterium]